MAFNGKHAGALLAAAMLAAQPCAAADADFQTAERRGAAFGGLKLSLPLGAGRQARPTARLQLTSTQSFRDARTGEVRSVTPRGLEFGLSEKGRAALYVGGTDTAEMKRKMGISTTTTLLIAGGVVLVLLVVAAASSGPGFPDCEPVGGNDDHCID